MILSKTLQGPVFFTACLFAAAPLVASVSPNLDARRHSHSSSGQCCERGPTGPTGPAAPEASSSRYSGLTGDIANQAYLPFNQNFVPDDNVQLVGSTGLEVLLSGRYSVNVGVSQEGDIINQLTLVRTREGVATDLATFTTSFTTGQTIWPALFIDADLLAGDILSVANTSGGTITVGADVVGRTTVIQLTRIGN